MSYLIVMSNSGEVHISRPRLSKRPLTQDDIRYIVGEAFPEADRVVLGPEPKTVPEGCEGLVTVRVFVSPSRFGVDSRDNLLTDVRVCDRVHTWVVTTRRPKREPKYVHIVQKFVDDHWSTLGIFESDEGALALCRNRWPMGLPTRATSTVTIFRENNCEVASIVQAEVHP